VADASLPTKPMVTALISRHGYRRVLVANTLLVGLAIASYALMSAAQPVWLHLLQLAWFGAVNSMQFTAMNAITLKDLAGEAASSGNSLLSMVQMLSMSLGVTAAGALLGGFAGLPGPDAAHHLPAFHATFLCVGLMTFASAWIFWQLPKMKEL
jgi:MFS family permease